MSKNDITGDDLKSKASTDAYREGHDRIFRIADTRYPVRKVDGSIICLGDVDNVDAPVNNGENQPNESTKCPSA